MPMSSVVWAVLLITGVVMPMVGWGFYRRPEVPFWTYAPVWRANDYLYPTGAFLWKAASTIFVIVGVATLIFYFFFNHHWPIPMPN